MADVDQTTPALTTLLDCAERQGHVTPSDVDEVARRHELAGEQVAELYDALDERGIEVDPEEESLRPAVVAYSIDDLSHHTTDALQIFLNEAGRYRLLTPPEEIELSKRIERGDLEAKERMINANLRLVVSIARKYQGV